MIRVDVRAISWTKKMTVNVTVLTDSKQCRSSSDLWFKRKRLTPAIALILICYIYVCFIACLLWGCRNVKICRIRNMLKCTKFRSRKFDMFYPNLLRTCFFFVVFHDADIGWLMYPCLTQITLIPSFSSLFGDELD